MKGVGVEFFCTVRDSYPQSQTERVGDSSPLLSVEAAQSQTERDGSRVQCFVETNV